MYVQCKLVLLKKAVLIEGMQNASERHSHERWAQEEFAGASLPDKRLVRRLQRIVSNFAATPSGSVPQASGSWKESKGAYRFFDNGGVSDRAILQPHQEQTARRMAGHKRVLVVQDTTGLNFEDHPATEGLGLIGSGRKGALGLWLHSSMALTPEGAALGLVEVQWWKRDPKEFGKAARRHSRRIEEKESYRWLQSYEATVKRARENRSTEYVNVADREGDLYDLFALAQQHPEVGVLVRARHERKDESGASIKELMARQEVAGTLEIQVPRRPGQAARKARLAIKFGEMMMQAPRRQKGKKPLKIWIVEAEEIRTEGSGQKPLFWRLMTNLEVKDFAGAVEKVGWYRQRWSIEEFHRILKSGCCVEDRQLETVERLSKIMRVDIVVAWRVLELNRVARVEPEMKAEEYFGEDELGLLKQLQIKNGKTVNVPMSVREAVRLIAQLGGFLGRKRDGEPGAMTLWRGLERLSQMMIGYQLAKLCG